MNEEIVALNHKLNQTNTKAVKVANTPLFNKVEPILTHLKYELVALNILKSNTITRLEILIDNLNGNNITLEDCTYVADYLSTVFDQEDPVSGKYRLEVSSPGIDRPLLKHAHYIRFKGEIVKITARVMQEGIKVKEKLIGKLTKVGDVIDNDFEIEITFTDGQICQFLFSDVKKANLEPIF